MPNAEVGKGGLEHAFPEVFRASFGPFSSVVLYEHFPPCYTISQQQYEVIPPRKVHQCHVTIMHKTSSLQGESDLSSLVPRPPLFSIPLALAVIRKIHRSFASVYYCECTQNVQWESLRPCPVLSYASLLPNLPNFCCSVCIHEWKQKNGENFAALRLPCIILNANQRTRNRSVNDAVAMPLTQCAACGK